MIKRAVLVLLIFAAVPAFADFNDVARQLRSELGRPTTIPFLGLARFATWIVRPHGVRDFELAVWEDKHQDVRMDGAGAERLLRRDLARDFQPVVRVRSNRSGEWTFIYAAARGDRFEIVLLTHDRSDTVLIRADVDAEQLSRTMREPRSMRRFASR